MFICFFADESHNHNDVGNFILFANTTPLLLDIGVGTYTAKTFSSTRYDIYYMQSQYHNTPTINGHQQRAGSGSGSSKTVMNQEGGMFVFSSNIAGAYPSGAQCKSWIRTFVMDQSLNQLVLVDDYELKKFIKEPLFHFMTTEDMEVLQNQHGLVLVSPQSFVRLNMYFDWNLFNNTVQIENRSLERDVKLTRVWGEQVKRITLAASNRKLVGKYEFRFSLEQVDEELEYL